MMAIAFRGLLSGGKLCAPLVERIERKRDENKNYQLLVTDAQQQLQQLDTISPSVTGPGKECWLGARIKSKPGGGKNVRYLNYLKKYNVNAE